MHKETEIKLRVSRETLAALREHPLLKKRNKSGWERRELFNQYFDGGAVRNQVDHQPAGGSVTSEISRSYRFTTPCRSG